MGIFCLTLDRARVNFDIRLDMVRDRTHQLGADLPGRQLLKISQVSRMALTDGELIRLVLAREPDATRQFVDTYAPLIQSAAARLLSRLAYTGMRRVPDIADAVQEIFRQLWERDFARLRGYDKQRGTLAAFLWTLSQNEASKLASSGRRSGYREVPSSPRTGELADRSGQSEADETDTARRIESKDALAVLFSELEAELDPTDRRLIELRFVEEQPSDMICAELRISPMAFYQRVSRLRKLIQQVAVRHGIGQPGLASPADPKTKVTKAS